jgi:hypothetical protein
MRSFTLPLVAAALVAAAGPLPAAAPVAFHVGTDWRKLTREECALKTVAALAKEKFILAEVTPEGDAWGCSEKTSVFVKAVPYGDGVVVLVFATGLDQAEVEGLRNRVREHVFDGPFDPDTPRQFKTTEAGRKPVGPVLRWDGGECETTQMRLFTPAALIALDRYKFQVQAPGPILTLGASEATSAGAYCVPGKGDAKGYVGAVVASFDGAEAEKLPKAIKARIVKILTPDD